MPFLPISPQVSDLKPVNIAQIVVAGLLPFVLTGCSSPKLAVAPVEPMPFWAMEYTVRTGESDRMAVTYGWRYVPVVKERVEAYLSEDDRKRADFLFQSVLEHNPTGVTSSWDNPTTGYSGTVTPTRTVTPKDQPPVEISSSSSTLAEMRPTGTVDISKKPAPHVAKMPEFGRFWRIDEWFIRFESTLAKRSAGWPRDKVRRFFD